MDIENQDVKRVSRFFCGMGAGKEQAEVMAKQLLRRAAQLAEKRHISLVESTEALLKQVIQARRGRSSEFGNDCNF